MGYGTIGSGVVEVLDINGSSIAKRVGEPVEIKYVLDLRDFPGDPIQDKIVHDYKTIAEDPEVKIVVETMGGVEPAYTFVKAEYKFKSRYYWSDPCIPIHDFCIQTSGTGIKPCAGHLYRDRTCNIECV